MNKLFSLVTQISPIHNNTKQYTDSVIYKSLSFFAEVSFDICLHTSQWAVLYRSGSMFVYWLTSVVSAQAILAEHFQWPFELDEKDANKMTFKELVLRK